MALHPIFAGILSGWSAPRTPDSDVPPPDWRDGDEPTDEELGWYDGVPLNAEEK